MHGPPRTLSIDLITLCSYFPTPRLAPGTQSPADDVHLVARVGHRVVAHRPDVLLAHALRRFHRQRRLRHAIPRHRSVEVRSRTPPHAYCTRALCNRPSQPILVEATSQPPPARERSQHHSLRNGIRPSRYHLDALISRPLQYRYDTVLGRFGFPETVNCLVMFQLQEKQFSLRSVRHITRV